MDGVLQNKWKDPVSVDTVQEVLSVLNSQNECHHASQSQVGRDIAGGQNCWHHVGYWHIYGWSHPGIRICCHFTVQRICLHGGGFIHVKIGRGW